MSGYFIVIEGIDGAGTTTQSRRLVDALRERGRDARHTFEPTNGAVGTLIRAVLEKRLPVPASGLPFSPNWATLALLFSADRLDHVDSFIDPALRENAVVVSDRYDLSSLAYQSVTSPEGPAVVPWLRDLNRRARRPDLTIVLEISAEEAAARRHARGSAEELFDADSVQRRLVEAYARAEELVAGDRVVHLSALGSVEAVGARILAAVSESFPELG